MCVQRLDDSQVCADRTTFRISLRSSSLQEPRDPLLKVVCCSHIDTSPDLHTCAEHEHGSERHSASLPEHMDARSGFVNDPTAGSPTVTLLRLVLPLNDQVCSTFHSNAPFEAVPRSEDLTKPFNR